MFNISNIKLGNFILNKSINGIDKCVGKRGNIFDKVFLKEGECIDRYIYGKCVVYSCVTSNQSLDVLLNGHGINGLSIGKLLGKLINEDLIKYSKNIRFPINKMELEESLRCELDKLSIIWSYKILDRIGLDSNSYCSVVIDWKIYDMVSDCIYPITIDIGSNYSWRLYDNILYEDSKNFKCDNESMVLEWLNSSWNMSDNVPSIICSRFNLNAELNLGYMDGPIPIWRYLKKGKDWGLELHTKFMEFYDSMPENHILREVFKLGGNQSLRNRDDFLRKYKNGEYPYINLGNTLMGKTKVLGVLPKYLNDSDRLISKVHLKISDSINKGKDNISIICNDGFGDCLTNDNLLDNYKLGMNSDVYLSGLFKKQIDNCKCGGIGWELKDGKPRHDDRCGLVCSLK